jgi:hypothetical protein
MPFYRVKVRTKRGQERARDEERRRTVRELIVKHGGKDASAHRPGAAFVVGIFRDRPAAKAFRDDARETLSQTA